MTEPGIEQIRSFRLRAHHLDGFLKKESIPELAGACGLQNTPPGAWETALYNRVSSCGLSEMNRLLYKEKTLLQAWSLRGAPVIFPVSESDVFLSALIPEEGEPWIYTNGISLALDFLQMSFDELFVMMRQALPQLDSQRIISKAALDQTIADWMLPLLPKDKKNLWNQPSMYGSPDKQTVGGAVVSFMLRPASFCGLAVFGERIGISPVFTSYKGWIGSPLLPGKDASQRLARKFLHCYGPATAGHFTSWLGCSGKQGRRIWKSVAEEMEPVTVNGKKAYILSEDRESLFSPAYFQRDFALLGGHDPYLDQRDRAVLQSDRSLHGQIWKTVSNPGAVLYRGEVTGIWTSRKKGNGVEIKMTLWSSHGGEQILSNLTEEYAAFRQLKLLGIEFL